MQTVIFFHLGKTRPSVFGLVVVDNLDISDLGILMNAETFSRIGLIRSYGNFQSYWTNTKLWKLTVVLG
jgi:hypothetical protein